MTTALIYAGCHAIMMLHSNFGQLDISGPASGIATKILTEGAYKLPSLIDVGAAPASMAYPKIMDFLQGSQEPAFVEPQRKQFNLRGY